MYSRTLGKNTVNGSPLYQAAVNSGYFTQRKDENQYRSHIPPGYVGNRFSETVSKEPSVKHHTGTVVREIVEIPEALAETPEGEETALPVIQEDAPVDQETAPAASARKTEPSPENPLNSLISIIKEQLSGDDLLIILLIFMLAKEGKDAEMTILLLTLLLLVN